MMRPIADSQSRAVASAFIQKFAKWADSGAELGRTERRQLAQLGLSEEMRGRVVAMFKEPGVVQGNSSAGMSRPGEVGGMSKAATAQIGHLRLIGK